MTVGVVRECEDSWSSHDDGCEGRFATAPVTSAKSVGLKKRGSSKQAGKKRGFSKRTTNDSARWDDVRQIRLIDVE